MMASTTPPPSLSSTFLATTLPNAGAQCYPIIAPSPIVESKFSANLPSNSIPFDLSSNDSGLQADLCLQSNAITNLVNPSPCTSCSTRLPAVAFCAQCEQSGGYGHLCSNCLSAHRFMYILQSHSVTNIDELSYVENGYSCGSVTTASTDNNSVVFSNQSDGTDLDPYTTSFNDSTGVDIAKCQISAEQKTLQRFNNNHYEALPSRVICGGVKIEDSVSQLSLALMDCLVSLNELLNASNISIFKDNQPVNGTQVKNTLHRSVTIARHMALRLRLPSSSPQCAKDQRCNSHCYKNSYNLDLFGLKQKHCDSPLCSNNSVDQLLAIINGKYELTRQPPKVYISLSGHIWVDDCKTPFTVPTTALKRNGLSQPFENEKDFFNGFNMSAMQLTNSYSILTENKLEKDEQLVQLQESMTALNLVRQTSTNFDSVSNIFDKQKLFRTIPLQISQRFGSPNVDTHCQLNNPSSLALIFGSRLIVADTGNHRLQLFGLNGEAPSHVDFTGFGQDAFTHPDRVAFVASSGTILISDRPMRTCRLQMFNLNGQYLRCITAIQQHVKVVGGLAVSPTGEIGLIDAIYPFNIVSLTENGDVIKWFHGKNFTEPCDMAIYESKCYICDHQKHLVVVVRLSDGECVQWIGNVDLTKSPTGVDIDRNGNLYVGCNGFENQYYVSIFSLNGEIQFKLEYPFLKNAVCLGLVVCRETGSPEANDRQICVATIDHNNNQVILLDSDLSNNNNITASLNQLH